MDQPSDRPAAEEYSFVMEDGTSEENTPLTLLRRSRRVLGDIDLEELAVPLSGESELPEQPVDKRREQVRKAQRTHRQRTQAYIKELEKEVLRLRTCKTNCLARVDQLEHRVDTLVTTLAEHNIPVPVEAPRPAPSSSGHVVIGAVDDPSASHFSLSFPQPGENLPMEVEPHASHHLHVSPAPGPTTSLAAGFSGENIGQTLLKDPRVGINFILTLERLCLDHLRTSHLDYDDRAPAPNQRARYSSQHLFTASLQLWQPSLRSRSAQESYDISAAEIERLLNTSLNIGVSDDEITPVQIWHHLKNFKLPEEEQKEFLDRLTGELCKLVECIHFGAVIRLRNFNEILKEHLPEAVIA